MHPILKLVLDIGPLIVFFGSYYALGIMPATGVFMAATLIAAAVSYALTRKVSPLMIFSAVVVMVFGGLTLWLHDETFIKLKPTIYYVTVAGILLGGLAFGRLVIKDVMDLAMHLTDEGWRKFTVRIAVFFLCMAVLNEIVWRNFDTDTWLLLKVWGFIPLSFVFFAAQMPLLMRYEIKPPADETSKAA
ncbi:MAG: septation protein A [Alphaproteobacteria bacterium]|nr:septation protein A [Alphaproteobacteria bacterium]